MLQIMNKLRPGATSSVAPCSRSAFGGRSKLTNWRSQSFTDAANEVNASRDVIRNAKRTRALQRRQTRQVPPVFTLKHLSHLTGVSYGFLRDCVERYGDEPYKVFRILKRQLPRETKPRYRMISVPDDRLMAAQRWINAQILQNLDVHAASTAFKSGSHIVEAASRHCGCRWLIKMDIVNFFESVSEQQVFHVFSAAGYQPLVAFELARICTRMGQYSFSRRGIKWMSPRQEEPAIPEYHSSLLGHLIMGLGLIMRRLRFTRRDQGGLCSAYWWMEMSHVYRSLTAKIWINICTLCLQKVSARSRTRLTRILRPFMG